jgi:glycerol-3-phosphate dehydrogenase
MYDLLIIGGGVNGAGIARDAAGRGLNVLLCEQGDLGSATSSASSKLIHGGLRYLENYEFMLVRKALAEREALLKVAPHIIWPLRFVLPVDKGMRPAWMLRIGLFIYDHLARRAVLPSTKTLTLQHSLQGVPLQPRMVIGFEYSDCWVDDARLVVLNAMDAASRGAEIATHTQCASLKRHADHWTAELKADGQSREVKARLVINAAGMWADDVLQRMGSQSNRGNIRLVKGSHIVTRKLFEGDHCYIFQTEDGRVVFAIPYQNNYTLIGTTEEDWRLDQGPPKISQAETDYLIGVINHYFKQPITADDIVWSYAGVRPLFDDQQDSASVVTRDYVFDLDDDPAKGAPVLSIFGGKLTTFRVLAEEAVNHVQHFFGDGSAWTEGAPLPGGDFDQADPFLAACKAQYPWLPSADVERMIRCYGTMIHDILGDATGTDALGQHFGHGLYAAEVWHLVQREFARSTDDILWRRTKLGLKFRADETEQLAKWLASNPVA